WGPNDYQRLAFLTRALRAEGEMEAAQANWRKALRTAAERHEFLAILAQMGGRWGWNAEVEEVLWLVSDKFPAQRWALQSLYEVYLSKANTPRMRDVYAAIVKADPTDYVAKNNLATASFLLRADLEKAHALAAEVNKADSRNPTVAST